MNPPADEGRDRNISGEIREKRRNAKAASVGWSAVVWLKLGHENTGGQKTQTHPDIGTQTRQKGVDDRRLPHCCCCCVVPLLFCCSVLSATFRCPKTRKKRNHRHRAAVRFSRLVPRLKGKIPPAEAHWPSPVIFDR